MAEHLRALIVILVLATVVFTFAKAPACVLACTVQDFERRRNLWFAITCAAFLAHNFWIFIVVTMVLLLFALPREPNKLALFYFLLFAVPMFSADIPGLGIINYLFAIDYVRLLALVILLPAYLYLRKQPDTESFGRLFPDRILAGYLILQFVLMLNRDDASRMQLEDGNFILRFLLLISSSVFTESLRHGAFYAFIDVFLPYYVASRSIRKLSEFRDVLTSFVLATLVLAALGAFEYAKQWLLYKQLEVALDAPRWGLGNYLGRESGLRALASVGQPICLGYVMVVATGFFLYLRKSITNTKAWSIGLIALLIGLIAPLSRGPWMGAAALLLVFVAAGPAPGKSLLKLGLVGIIVISVLLVSPASQVIINHLPFVGTVETENVTYRQRLFTIGTQVILQNPFFGAFDYLKAPAMQELKQGQGIIDIVNSYLEVALRSGLVGLSLYAGFFLVVAIGIYNGMRTLRDGLSESYLLGQSLLATLAGILIVIATTSSITIIPVIYWSVAGLGVAYSRMLALEKSPAKAPHAVVLRATQPARIRRVSPIGSGRK